MTDFRKLRLALIAGLAVPALALTACSSDDSDSDSSSPDSSNGSDSSDSDGEDSGSASDVELEGAPDDFELTAPGSKLSLGDDAYVVTQRGSGEDDDETYPIQYWKVTAQEITDVPKEDIELSSDADEVEKFLCVNYNIEFLGASDGSNPETAHIVKEPYMRAVDDNGNGANTILMSSGSDCGIHSSDELPSGQDELQEGKVYKDAALSYETNDGSGVTPTGLEFRFEADLEDLENADSIYWN